MVVIRVILTSVVQYSADGQFTNALKIRKMRRYFTLGILLLSMHSFIYSQSPHSSFVHFDSDDYTLDAQSRIQINDLLLELERHSDFNIQVIGHTDQDGSEAYNETLAQKRAETVTDYMIGLGIAESRITQLSKGERDLLRQELSHEAKQENRRVELKYNYSDYATLQEVVEDVGTSEAQSHSIVPEESHLIDLDGGTSIYVPKGAFVYADGSPVTEAVTVEVIEAYSLTDFMQHDLFTESKGELIETGGMLHIAANVDGTPVELGENKSLELIYPVQEIEEGMELFYGETTDEGMTWAPADRDFTTSQVKNNPIMLDLDPIINYNLGRLERTKLRFPEMPPRPRYPRKPFPPSSLIYSEKKYEEMYANYEKNLDNWINGRPKYEEREAAWQEIVSERLGTINDFKQGLVETEYRIKIALALKSLKALEGRRAPAEKLQRVFSFIKRPMRINIDGRKLHKAAFGNYTREVVADRAISFNVEGYWVYPKNDMCSELKKMVFDAEQTLREQNYLKTGKIDGQSFGSYVSGIDKLGWINCDRFRPGYEKTDLIVNKVNNSTRHYLVYKDLRSFMSGRRFLERIRFNDAAVGQEVKLISISLVDEKPQMGVQEFTIGHDQVIDVELKPCSLEDIKAELNSVDNERAKGVEQESLSYDLDLKVFPNPTAVSFTAVVAPIEEVREMAIYDLRGKMVKKISAGREGSEVPVSVSEFENGTYLVTAFFNNGNSTSEQLVIQNE